MQDSLLQQRLIGLFALALLLFNFPLLALWDREATILGLPLFPAALFLLWGLLIAMLAWLMESSSPGEPSAHPPEAGVDGGPATANSRRPSDPRREAPVASRD